MTDYEAMNAARAESGFYTLEEMLEKVCRYNLVYDLYSTLISSGVELGIDNTFYPGIVLQADEGSLLRVGSANIFASGTHFTAENGGQILVGDHNLFDDGPVSVRSNRAGGVIRFADHGRYDGRINIFGNCDFGFGSQLIGTLNVYSCVLKPGGDFSEPDPDNRAGLLKGMGTAKGLTVEKGMVINGFGTFEQSSVEPQANYHKK